MYICRQSTPKTAFNPGLGLPTRSLPRGVTQRGWNGQASSSTTTAVGGAATAEDHTVPIDPIFNFPVPAPISVPHGYPKTQGKRVASDLGLWGILPENGANEWKEEEAEDDEILRILRRTQSVLRSQTKIKQARKAIIKKIVKERMSVQEFETIEEGLDRLLDQLMIKKNEPLNASFQIPSVHQTGTSTASSSDYQQFSSPPATKNEFDQPFFSNPSQAPQNNFNQFRSSPPNPHHQNHLQNQQQNPWPNPNPIGIGPSNNFSNPFGVNDMTAQMGMQFGQPAMKAGSEYVEKNASKQLNQEFHKNTKLLD
ncbi:Transcriptional regulator [Puccinia graminis f. sp. tritici]|uniref:Transcriptional regulator n=1 Tax=Puccinia graminis f. sp. tritici TaxID=56615 RepID=A0A5B0QWJ9_PUCGR|nr:Transcriptional regulator [Puccinia graminis f. sp. tritici]